LYFLTQIGDLRHLGGLCGWLCGGLVEHQVSYVDLLGVVRSKLVPLSAIQTMERTGAGFAGYAAHFLMTAADSDMVDVYSLLHVCIVNTSQKQKWNFFCIDVQVAWTSLFLN
jgi:glutamine synthetase